MCQDTVREDEKSRLTEEAGWTHKRTATGVELKGCEDDVPRRGGGEACAEKSWRMIVGSKP